MRMISNKKIKTIRIRQMCEESTILLVDKMECEILLQHKKSPSVCQSTQS
jgi:hypothetical protein